MVVSFYTILSRLCFVPRAPSGVYQTELQKSILGRIAIIYSFRRSRVKKPQAEFPIKLRAPRLLETEASIFLIYKLKFSCGSRCTPSKRHDFVGSLICPLMVMGASVLCLLCPFVK